MADEIRIPEPPNSWIGQEVRLSYWMGDKRGSADCVIRSVGDRGVTVVEKEEIRFFPWQAVLEIAPLSHRRPSRAAGR